MLYRSSANKEHIDSQNQKDNTSHHQADYFTDNTEIDRQSRAAILIQRITRGAEARTNISKKKQSLAAQENFEKLLDPNLSPAENASKALLDLAEVDASLGPTLILPHSLLHPEVESFVLRCIGHKICSACIKGTAFFLFWKGVSKCLPVQLDPYIAKAPIVLGQSKADDDAVVKWIREEFTELDQVIRVELRITRIVKIDNVSEGLQAESTSAEVGGIRYHNTA